jgi:hypothetical protein
MTLSFVLYSFVSQNIAKKAASMMMMYKSYVYKPLYSFLAELHR